MIWMHSFQFCSQLKPHKACQTAVTLTQLCFKLKKSRYSLQTGLLLALGLMCRVPGCVCPVNFLGIPLVVVRGRSGKIKVFENVCRHRGMILVEEAKRLNGRITCPYHAWAYDFDGTLRATPHVGGPDIHEHHSVDCTALSLNEIPSAIWRDVIYVNLSGKAPPFEEKQPRSKPDGLSLSRNCISAAMILILSLMLPVTGS